MLDGVVHDVRRRHRRASAVLVAAIVLPVVAALIIQGLPALALVGAALGLLAWGGLAVFHHGSISAESITRLLNHHIPELEYSADLLGDSAPTGWLAQRQRSRIERRLNWLMSKASLGELLLPGWLTRIGLAVSVGIGLGAVALLAGAVYLAQWRLTIAVSPPAYTGIAKWTTKIGERPRIPEGSMLLWQWQGAGATPPDVSVNAQGLGFTAMSDRWETQLIANENLLVAITEDDGVSSYPIEVIPDLPPQVSLTDAPERALEFASDATPQLQVRFLAGDDYAISRISALVTLARGDGESVRFRDQVMPITVNPAPGDNQYDVTIDHAAFSMQPGDEVYVRIEVADNRPDPQTTRSRAVIFRWLRDQEPAQGVLAALVVDRLPEYFRSQRQIIIDTEAILAEAQTLDQATVLARSQIVSRDQRTLRMRYGQYLGEEESTDIGVVAGEEEHALDREGFGGQADDATPEFLEPFVHAHDSFLEATMFDESTRQTLVTALNAMWRAELELGLGSPADALPHEYEALRHLKLVQQAARIYVKRVGFEPPPLDEDRRHTGELDDVESYERFHTAPSDANDRNLALLQSLMGHSSQQQAQALREIEGDTNFPIAIRSDAAGALNRSCEACRARVIRHLWNTATPPRPWPDREKADQLRDGAT